MIAELAKRIIRDLKCIIGHINSDIERPAQLWSRDAIELDRATPCGTVPISMVFILDRDHDEALHFESERKLTCLRQHTVLFTKLEEQSSLFSGT